MDDHVVLTKQVIVMRKDLNMRKGKMVAQGSHASMSFLTRRIQNGRPLTEIQREWLKNSFTKICVSVDSEQELMDIARQAEDSNVECHVITDNGTTEFNGVPTKTCLALGPDKPEVLDKISGHLRLL
jgi:PTH2 family peptidyl-tRNA hydrolase